MTARTLQLAPLGALIAVTAVWGSTFFLIGDLVQDIPPLDFLGVRFTIAAIIVIAVAHRRLFAAPKELWSRGAALGAVYSAAQMLQTYGLQTTPASISGFITGMYVVLTPILLAVFFRQRVTGPVWVAVFLATCGLAFLSLQPGSGTDWAGIGEVQTFLGAALYALHIVLLSRWATTDNAAALGMIQIVTVGAICGLSSLSGGVTLPQTAGGWAVILYMAIIAGLGAMLLQTWAQARVGAATAAIIMTTEPVFATAFAVMLGGEVLTVRLLLGGALVLGAMILVEVPLPVRSKRAV